MFDDPPLIFVAVFGLITGVVMLIFAIGLLTVFREMRAKNIFEKLFAFSGIYVACLVGALGLVVSAYAFGLFTL